uniref:Uncharacterized protein n=1 Tax=Cucumis melo TaxID=3656 RepID=A0A9I9ELQ2_CUCME
MFIYHFSQPTLKRIFLLVWVKSSPPTVSSLCFVLVISLSIFRARTLRTSTHTPGMLPDTFSQGKGNGLSSMTFSVRPKKMQAIMPQTQFSRPGVKSGLPTVSSFYFVLVKTLSIFGVVLKRWSMLPTSGERSSIVKNH